MRNTNAIAAVVGLLFTGCSQTARPSIAASTGHRRPVAVGAMSSSVPSAASAPLGVAAVPPVSVEETTVEPAAAASSFVEQAVAGRAPIVGTPPGGGHALDPWLTSLGVDDRAAVIGSYLLARSARRASVIVSVASPGGEPIGYRLSLVDDGQWRVTSISFA